jgi:hypothetical protein
VDFELGEVDNMKSLVVVEGGFELLGVKLLYLLDVVHLSDLGNDNLVSVDLTPTEYDKASAATFAQEILAQATRTLPTEHNSDLYFALAEVQAEAEVYIPVRDSKLLDSVVKDTSSFELEGVDSVIPAVIQDLHFQL